MRTTNISFLSGFGNTESQTFNLGDYLSDDKTIASNYLRVFSFTNGYYADFFSFLSDFIDGKNQEDVQLIGYLCVDFLSKQIPFTQTDNDDFIVKFQALSSSSVEKGKFVLTNAESPDAKNFLSWWDTNIMANNYMAPVRGGLEIAQSLFDTASLFLYCVIDNSRLSQRALEVKIQQQNWLATFTAATWASGATALEIIRSGIANVGYTPEQLLSILKGKKPAISAPYDVPYYTGEYQPDFDLSKLDLSSLSTSQQSGYVSIINNILSWVTTAADGFSKVYTALKKNDQGMYIPQGGGFYPVPSPSDFDNTTLYMVAGGVGLVALVLLLTRKKGENG
jgi:hypothetical protein